MIFSNNAGSSEASVDIILVFKVCFYMRYDLCSDTREMGFGYNTSCLQNSALFVRDLSYIL